MYVVREKIKGSYDITNFDDDVYTTYVVKNGKCNCMGYSRQHNKKEHKHCKLVDFWINNLDKEPGFALWFDGEDIEYNRFIDIYKVKEVLCY
jgi:hypothetical protein